MDKSSAKKEGVTSEELDSELSRFILNKCAEVLDPTMNSGIVGVSRKAVSDPPERDEVEDADRPISRVVHQLKEIPIAHQNLAVPAISPIGLHNGASGMKCETYLASCEAHGNCIARDLEAQIKPNREPYARENGRNIS